MEPIAHRTEDGREQPLREHLAAVAERAAEFAEVFDCKAVGEMLGLYHDIGKCSREWQAYIRDPRHRGHFDHSTAGARELFRWEYEDCPWKALLANCVKP